MIKIKYHNTGKGIILLQMPVNGQLVTVRYHCELDKFYVDDSSFIYAAQEMEVADRGVSNLIKDAYDRANDWQKDIDAFGEKYPDYDGIMGRYSSPDATQDEIFDVESFMGSVDEQQAAEQELNTLCHEAFGSYLTQMRG